LELRMGRDCCQRDSSGLKKLPTLNHVSPPS
jgi:hypothetical protein